MTINKVGPSFDEQFARVRNLVANPFTRITATTPHFAAELSHEPKGMLNFGVTRFREDPRFGSGDTVTFSAQTTQDGQIRNIEIDSGVLIKPSPLFGAKILQEKIIGPLYESFFGRLT